MKTLSLLYVMAILSCSSIAKHLYAEDAAAEIKRRLSNEGYDEQLILTVSSDVAKRHGLPAVAAIEAMVEDEWKKDACNRTFTVAGCAALAELSSDPNALFALARLCKPPRYEGLTVVPLMPQASRGKLLLLQLNESRDKDGERGEFERVLTSVLISRFADDESCGVLRDAASRHWDPKFQLIVTSLLGRRVLIKESVPLSEPEIELLERDFWFVPAFTIPAANPDRSTSQIALTIRKRRTVPLEYVIASTYMCRLANRVLSEGSSSFDQGAAKEMARQSLPEVIALANDASRHRELRNQAIEVVAAMKSQTAAEGLAKIYREADGVNAIWIGEAILRQQPPKRELRELLTTLEADERLPAELRRVHR